MRRGAGVLGWVGLVCGLIGWAASLMPCEVVCAFLAWMWLCGGVRMYYAGALRCVAVSCIQACDGSPIAVPLSKCRRLFLKPAPPSSHSPDRIHLSLTWHIYNPVLTSAQQQPRPQPRPLPSVWRVNSEGCRCWLNARP